MPATRNFIPFPMYWDDVPLDLSFLYEGERPAGKHGFLEVAGPEFRFEDGSPARFWGTNFNSGGNFPSHEYSRTVARRLAKIGVNLVRFHQLDSEWATPNIFQFTKGPRKGNSLSLDPESMDRLDYLIHSLREQGIYFYFDMLTYRKFKTEDGVRKALSLADAAKPYCLFDRRLVELQKDFCGQVWNHLNPYTGLAYKDDPAIVMTEIVNECDLFSRKAVLEPWRSELEAGYAAWRAGRGLAALASPADFSQPDEGMLDFLALVQEDYYVEMMAHLRSLGVKIPIAGTNWSINAANRRSQLVTDFADGHTYWYKWKWTEGKREFHNGSMVAQEDSVLPELSFSRFLDRPFFVSEWDDPWPNEWRAESPLFMAAVGSLQGWSGFAIHTYSYSTMTGVDRTGKEVSSRAIGGVPYREGVFNTWNDPAKFGLFYHAALMFRRGDILPARECVGVRPESLASTPASTAALSRVSEIHRVGLELEGLGRAAASPGPAPGRDGLLVSDTGQLRRDPGRRFGTIDSPMTKAAYGFLGGAGRLALEGLEIEAATDFAVIALSSICAEPIGRAKNLFLVTSGRSENSGMEFDHSRGEFSELLELGVAPILIEVIEAELALQTEIETLRVWAVNAEGFFIGVIPSEYRDGWLRFSLGPVFPSMYYLIQAE